MTTSCISQNANPRHLLQIAQSTCSSAWKRSVGKEGGWVAHRAVSASWYRLRHESPTNTTRGTLSQIQPKPAGPPKIHTEASTMQASKTISFTKWRVALKWLISEIQRFFPSTSSDLTQRQSASSSLEIKPTYLVAPIQINLSAKGRCEGNQQLWINVDNQVINY